MKSYRLNERKSGGKRSCHKVGRTDSWPKISIGKSLSQQQFGIVASYTSCPNYIVTNKIKAMTRWTVDNRKTKRNNYLHLFTEMPFYIGRVRCGHSFRAHGFPHDVWWQKKLWVIPVNCLFPSMIHSTVKVMSLKWNYKADEKHQTCKHGVLRAVI